MSTPLTPLQIAEVCHEANRGFQRAVGQPVAREWSNCGEDMQQSAMHGVKVAQEGNGPEELHRQWLMVKEAQGWKYGKVKDEVAKTHPCMVPYDELSFTDRQKDMLFQAIVRALTGTPSLDLA